MYPAAAAIGLEYWNNSPKPLVGRMVASTFIAPSGVRSWNSSNHSRSCRGMPVHAQMRCFTRTLLVVSASPSLNDGNKLAAGVSQVIFPSATRRASIRVASALVLDAIM
jgi:hypothetical protein